MSMSMQNWKVLVLNKAWRAVGVVTLVEAMKKICGEYRNGEPKARIIDCINDFQSMTWDDWSALKPNPNYCSDCHKVMPNSQIEDGHCMVCSKPVGEAGINSINAVFRVPRVIQLTRYDKLPVTKIHYNRRTIYKRDNNTCQYCGAKPGTKELSIDHVVPRAQGGKTEWTNVVVACTPCNAKKADRTPAQCGMKLLSTPVKPKYNLYTGDAIVKDWESFLGASYWMTSLENDMTENG